METFLDSLARNREWLLLAALTGELVILAALTIAGFILHRRLHAFGIVMQTWMDPAKRSEVEEFYRAYGGDVR